jgi:hypothetical protein
MAVENVSVALGSILSSLNMENRGLAEKAVLSTSEKIL